MFEEIISTLPAQQQSQLQTLRHAEPGRTDRRAQGDGQEAKARKLTSRRREGGSAAVGPNSGERVYQDLVAQSGRRCLKAYYAAHKGTGRGEARHILIRMQGSRVPVRGGHKDLTTPKLWRKPKCGQDRGGGEVPEGRQD